MVTPRVLQNGNCEPLKAATHGLMLGMALVCASYNLAAWIVRRWFGCDHIFIAFSWFD